MEKSRNPVGWGDWQKMPPFCLSMSGSEVRAKGTCPLKSRFFFFIYGLPKGLVVPALATLDSTILYFRGWTFRRLNP